MSLWSMCSNSRLKSGIMRGIECNSLLMQMQIYDSKITQTARKFSRTHIALKDYYSALGVTKIATQQDIKNAYYRLSKIHHPDKNKGCENSAELFRIATEAYEVLGNYRTRRLYDKGVGIRSKKSVQEDEVAPIVEEDDAQTKFYKQHMRRSEKPFVSGRSTISDFDDWSRKTITESFQKAQQNKQNREMDIRMRREKVISDDMFKLVIVLTAIIIITLSMLALVLDESKPEKRNEPKK